MRQHHDLGGEPLDDPIDRDQDDLDLFASRVAALVTLARDGKRRIFVTDELRRAIESIPPADYDRLSYYERWVTALRALLEEKGVLTAEQIEARMAQVRQRLAGQRP